MAKDGGVLVISDGSVAGLAALAIASEETVRRESAGSAAAPMVWAAWVDGVTPEARTAAVARHASALGAHLVERPPVVRMDAETPGAALNRLLLRAGEIALASGRRRIVWPVQHEGPTPDEPAGLETIAESVNRATLVSRLLTLDAPAAGLPEAVIETPFVDLSDAQLAEVAFDLAVAFEDCWWWAEPGSNEATRLRSRWGRVAPSIA